MFIHQVLKSCTKLFDLFLMAKEKDYNKAKICL